ncbi:MAG: pyrroline-5-carboxylate reductase [Verrucomicrobiota bacterium]|jgi:pyrroline-5-carboxylate reductase
MAAKLNIGFLGAGKMAAALARGFISAGLAMPGEILAGDPAAAARTAFARETGARTTSSNVEVAKFASLLILAVKPACVNDLLAELRGAIAARHLIISIAAGVTIAQLERGLGAGLRVIRVMPNTAALIGASASAYSRGKMATPADGALTERLFGSVGMIIELKETLLDAVTGLSGSGPAYVCVIIEALSDGGVAAGLPREVAAKLATQTVMGAARMVLETGLHPGALKDMVTSPGGTTIEGLHELEKGKIRAVLMSAVRAATEKSKKLGQG